MVQLVDSRHLTVADLSALRIMPSARRYAG